MRPTIKAVIGRMLTIQVVRYILVGGVAAGVAILTSSSLYTGHLTNYTVAQGLGFIAGGLVNYPLSRRWVFRNRSRLVARQLAVFYSLALAGLSVNEWTLRLCVVVAQVPVVPAMGAGLGAAFLWNFTGNKFVTFSRRFGGPSPRPQPPSAGFEPGEPQRPG